MSICNILFFFLLLFYFSFQLRTFSVLILFYVINTGFYSLKKYSIRNQRIPSVCMRKKYRNGFWMESKFLQHSWRQLVCYKELSTHPQCFQYAHVFLKQPLLLNTSTFSRILSSGQLENLNTSLQSGQYFCTQENLNTKWFWHGIQ